MRFLLISIFACAFVLFLETDAQAPEFSGNTCNEEGANCQTDDDWVYGWCEAAVEAGVFIGTAEQCIQPGGGGGQLVRNTQNENPPSSDSDSGQSSNRRKSEQRQERATAQANDNANDNNEQAELENDQTCTGADCDSEQDTVSGNSDNASSITCLYWRVRRSDPTNFVCAARPGFTSKY